MYTYLCNENYSNNKTTKPKKVKGGMIYVQIFFSSVVSSLLAGYNHAIIIIIITECGTDAVVKFNFKTEEKY